MKFNLKKDLSNERFGKLLVIEPVGKTPNRHIIIMNLEIVDGLTIKLNVAIEAATSI